MMPRFTRRTVTYGLSGLARAEDHDDQFAEQARLQMRRELGAAVARLEDMQHANASSALDAEIAAMRDQLDTLDAGLLEFRIRLDALRVILVVPATAG